MKTACLIVLMIIFSAGDLYSQEEWEWRDSSYSELKLRVLRRTDYHGETFKGKVDFRKSIFTSKAIFDSVRFDSLADFTGAKFTSKAIFREAVFRGKADFSGVQFDSAARFYWFTQFWGSVSFEFARFNSRAYFAHMEFANEFVTFRSASFKDEVSFERVLLPKKMDFSNVRDIAHEVDLFNAYTAEMYHNKCLLSLSGADISKFDLDYLKFELFFPLRWGRGYEFKSAIYGKILHMQKQKGYTQSYEKLDKEYRAFQYTDPGGKYLWPFGYILNFVDKTWWGYGYNKERLVLITFLIYLLFSLINTFWLKHLTTSVYTNEEIQELLKPAQGETQPIGFGSRFWYSLFYTGVIFFGLKFDMEKLKYKDNLKGQKRWNLVYFFTIYLGGFVCLAYLANYIITI